MKANNQTIFDNAQAYLDQNKDDNRLFPLKISLNEKNKLEEHRSTRKKEQFDFDNSKSLIGIVGQLQKSGISNAVCISDCDYITLGKIRSDKKCKEIIDFFEKFI